MSRTSAKKRMFAAIAQNCGREGLHIMTNLNQCPWCMRTAGRDISRGADNDLRNARRNRLAWGHRDNLEPSPWHHEPV